MRLPIRGNSRKIIITCAPTGSIHTPSMSPYLPVGPAQLAHSNADQVRKIRTILEQLGLEIATPAEARTMLALKGADSVRF